MNPLRGCDLANPDRETALITCSRILLDDAPFGGAVNHGERLRHDSRGAFRVLGFEQAAERTNLVAQPRSANTIDFRSPLGDAHTLQG